MIPKTRFRPVVLCACALLGCALASAGDRPLSREARLRADANAIETTIQAVGDWDGHTELLADWRTAVARRIENGPRPRKGKSFIAKDVPLEGRNGFLISGRRAKQLLFDADTRSKDPIGVKRLESFYETALRLDRLLQRRGVDLMLVPVPDKSDVYPEHLAPLPGKATTVMLQSKRVYLQLMRAGVEVVDLEPAFREQAGRGKRPLYMKRDTHWSPRACRLAAEEIARRLRRYDWMPTDTADRYVSAGARGLRWLGDLEKNWRRAGRKAHGVEKYPFPAVRKKRGRISKRRDARVQIAGDSYAVFPYNNSQAVWAYLAAAIGEPVHVEDRAGGAATLAKRFFHLSAARNKQTRVVIWLFTNCSLYEQEFTPPRPPKGDGPSDDTERTAQLRVTLRSAAPKLNPKTLDYANALVAVTADVDRVVKGAFEGESVLLVFPAVRDREKTPAAGLKKGDALEVTLDWTIPRKRAAWMLIDRTDELDLHPWYVRAYSRAKGN